MIFWGLSQDGGGIGWGDHFLPHKFIQRSLECWATSIKELLNAGRGHQAHTEAAQSLQKEGFDYWLDCCLPFWLSLFSSRSPLAFGPSLKVASSLLHPYSTEDKTPRLMVKQFSTPWNIQKDSELHREEKKEVGDRGDQKKKRGVKREESNLASNQFPKCSPQSRTPREIHSIM